MLSSLSLSQRPQSAPACSGLSVLGSWQQAFEITKCWQHRFDMNMQIRIFKSPAVLLDLFKNPVTNRD